MNTIRMKVALVQAQQREGQEAYANVQMTEVVNPATPSMSPYGVSSMSLALMGADAEGINAGDVYDITLTAATGA